MGVHLSPVCHLIPDTDSAIALPAIIARRKTPRKDMGLELARSGIA
jgi:hypothetical protein